MSEAADTGPVVIKLGGEVIRSATLHVVAADVAAMAKRGTAVVLVHGGGPQATELQKKLGQEPKIVGGRRVTDHDTLDVMKMTVCGLLNVDLCAALVAKGARPVGLHGASSLVIHARKRPPTVVAGGGPDPIDFGFVGDVVGLNEELLALLVGAGHVPVLACLGADEHGETFNINADAVANQIAARLKARALVLVSDVSGVLRDVTDAATRIPRLTKAEADQAVATGIIQKGMIPKVEESFAAIRAGVAAVHIVGRLREGDLEREVETPGSVGTVLVPS